MHFPDLEVCCDWFTFFPVKSAEVRGAGTREEPLRTSAWYRNRFQKTRYLASHADVLRGSSRVPAPRTAAGDLDTL